MSQSSDPQKPHDSIGEWIHCAQEGSEEALGKLLEACRPYLLLVANQELPADLRGKAGASDLVQETFLQAHLNFDRFQAHGEAGLRAWLRRILLNNLANLKRNYTGTGKRDLGLERPLAKGSFGEGFRDIQDVGPSPSSLAVAAERDIALKRALMQLPEDYRSTIHWRNYERLSFEEIGSLLGRSAGAAQKLWIRAIERLQELLDDEHGE